MFRVIFFILFFSLTLYGIWGLFTPLRTIEQQDVNARYEAYLSGALARNSGDFERYDVVFYTKDFDDRANSTQNNTGNLGEKTSSIHQNLYNFSRSGENDTITSLRGNFGTPEIIKTPLISIGDSSCAGIIFDPCVTLNIPNSGEIEAMYLGTTRIYDNPHQRG